MSEHLVVLAVLKGSLATLIEDVANDAEHPFVLHMEDSLTSIDFSRLASLPPDVIVCDLDGPEAVEIRNWSLVRAFAGMAARIVGITTGESIPVLEAALALGVTGLQYPTVSADSLTRVIQAAGQGLVDFDPDLLVRAKESFMHLHESANLIIGGLSINTEQETASRWGLDLGLSKLEYRVVLELARSANRWVTTEELLERVWQTKSESGGTGDQVKSCIKRIRSKLEPVPGHPRYLVSSKARGYQLRDPFPEA